MFEQAFRNLQHPDLRADTATRVSAKSKSRSHSAGLLRSERQLRANLPFTDSDWFRKDDDVRWKFGMPPVNKANYAWMQHFIHHLAPVGVAGFVRATRHSPGWTTISFCGVKPRAVASSSLASELALGVSSSAR
jgi:N-6 DNA Methylase